MKKEEKKMTLKEMALNIDQEMAFEMADLAMKMKEAGYKITLQEHIEESNKYCKTVSLCLICEKYVKKSDEEELEVLEKIRRDRLFTKLLSYAASLIDCEYIGSHPQIVEKIMPDGKKIGRDGTEYTGKRFFWFEPVNKRG